MPEQIRCPECDATLRVPDNLLGKSVKCPKCQTTFTATTEAPDEPERIVKEPIRASSRRPSPPVEEEEDEELPPEDEEEEERPRRRRRRRRRSSAEAESAVAGPAIALMIVGGIALGLAILGLVLNLLGVGLLAANPRGMAGPQQADSARMFGSVVGGIIGICYGGIITSGAVKMKNLSSYGYAMTACIVAMLPCSLCCLLGLPFGIWGLVMLNKPEVKDAFS
ncbi:MAG TPA: zinc-ribbon domain-containing protein [Gemmataceae bacterium]|jgi:predicted Zn finger-like uncharacterized protein